MFYSILLTICNLICKLSTSLAIADTLIQKGGISIPGYFHWNHSSVASTVLYCPDCCSKISDNPCIINQFATDKVAACCVIWAKPFWVFPENKNITVPLEIKFTKSEHTDLVDFHNSNETVHLFRHTDGNLTIFPDNICNYPRLVEIDLEGNKIENLTNLGCIHFLDSLNLKYNKIKMIRASYFSNMKYLRVLNLSHNLITYLEAGAFKYRPGSLTHIWLDWNFLTIIDVSDVVLGYFFGGISFRGNRISNITNKFNWTGFSKGDIIGGGGIDVRQNNLSRMSALSPLGHINAVMRGSFNYQLFLDENPWSCDCDTYQYILLASDATRNFDGLVFYCASPPSLVGYFPKKFRDNPLLLSDLICNVSLEDKCPPKCYCYKQPSAQRVVVNCSSTDRSLMPKEVPNFDDLEIDFSYNFIQFLKNLNYLHRATRIDLSYNIITFVDPVVYGIQKLNFINLEHNQMTSLDRTVQLKNPCQLRFGNVTLTKCNCEMLWIKVWLQRQKAEKCALENVITCQKNSESVNLMLLSDGDLCQIKQSYDVYWSFAGATFLILIIITTLYHNFKFEIKLFFRMLKLHLYCIKSNKNCYEYDLYLSFNMENNDVLNWTMRTVTTFFESQGYTLCIPQRDFIGGAIQVDEICTNINKSKSFLVVLSQDYERSKFQNIEWKHIWNTVITDSMTTITIVNFDCLESKEIIDRKLKSFLRLGYSVNFYNFHKNLLNDIQVNMGPPIYQETVVFSLP